MQESLDSGRLPRGSRLSFARVTRPKTDPAQFPPGDYLSLSFATTGVTGGSVWVSVRTSISGSPPPRPAAVAPETYAEIAVTLAAAAADDGLPFTTRLKLLRETTAPGGLSAEQTRMMFERLRETHDRRMDLVRQYNDREALKADRGLYDRSISEYDAIGEEQKAILAALAELRAAPQTADEVVLLANMGGMVNLAPDALATVLRAGAAEAEGLRRLLDALKTVRPGSGSDRPVEKDAALLLDAVRAARPATDDAARVLLDAAGSDDAEVRAAAVEALAGAGG